MILRMRRVLTTRSIRLLLLTLTASYPRAHSCGAPRELSHSLVPGGAGALMGNLISIHAMKAPWGKVEAITRLFWYALVARQGYFVPALSRRILWPGIQSDLVFVFQR